MKAYLHPETMEENFLQKQRLLLSFQPLVWATVLFLTQSSSLLSWKGHFPFGLDSAPSPFPISWLD
jgi:hypothetical protein